MNKSDNNTCMKAFTCILGASREGNESYKLYYKPVAVNSGVVKPI